LIVSRTFAMPDSETFTVPPIKDFVKKYLREATVSVDPFARNRTWFTHTNDLNPATQAQHHMDAEDFLKKLKADGVQADLGIFDPPYSPRQIAEVYKSIGLTVGMQETQNGRLYKRVRDALDAIMKPDGIVLSFGWQSAGMGKGRGYEPLEIALINHGGGHNDTICMAERKRVEPQLSFSTADGTKDQR
jgi:hypothetical protein